MNIYDEKRRNTVEAYCGVQSITPTERCIQLENTIDMLNADKLTLRRERNELRRKVADLTAQSADHEENEEWQSIERSR